MAYCSSCGSKLEDGTNYCPKCGKPTESGQNNENSNSPIGYSVELIGNRAAKLQVVKALVDELGLDIKNAKDLVDSVPCTIAEGLTLSKAKELGKIMEKAGAKIVVKENGIQVPTPQVNKQLSNKVNPIDEFKKGWKEADINNINEQRTSKMGCWKKILIAFFIMMFVGFLANKCDNDGDKDSTSRVTSSAVEEKEQETTEERQAREQEEEQTRKAQQQKEEADRQEHEQQEKVKKVADMAYKKGYENRMSTRDMSDPKVKAHIEYTVRYGIDPETQGEERRWKVFLENYLKGYEDAWQEICKRMDSENI